MSDSTMEWSFQNKVSGAQQFVSFNGKSGEKPKIGFESLASTGLVSITTIESLHSNNSYPGGVMQRNMVPEKQGVIRSTMTCYPALHLDAHSIHCPDVRFHPISGQMNPTISVGPSQKPIISRACLTRSASSNAVKLGEISGTGTIPSSPACSNVVGTTDLRNDSKSPVKPAQLTIFYNGSVCVYDDISPEKAQAIMLLAGNGPPSVPCGTAVITAPIQSPSLRSPLIDGHITNRAHNMKPSSPSPISIAIPSHISFSSGVISQSGGGYSSSLDINPIKSSMVISHPYGVPSKDINMLGSFPDASKSSGVPQARKASLARFLDRRKGRIISPSPYAKNESSNVKVTTSTSISLEMSS